MDNIFKSNEEFDFSKLSLGQPSAVLGGSYFTKILLNGKPFYTETPESTTKQGFIKNGKKIYCDLMFNMQNEDFIKWMENLEARCHTLIYEKSDSWFENKLELEDIESAFNAPLKVYKSGKFYLLRVNVKNNYSNNIPNIKIYNENENSLSIDDVNSESKIISIIEILGIKFSSKSFQIDIDLKQIMVLNNEEIFESCLIKSHQKQNSNIKSVSYTEENINNRIEDNNAIDNNIYLSIDKQNQDQYQDQDQYQNPNNIDKLNKEKKEKLESLSDKILETEKMYNSVFVEQSLEDSNKKYKKESNEKSEKESESLCEDIKKEEIVEPFQLSEYEIQDNLDDLEVITLKKPNQVYYEIYQEARKKAKKAKRDAIIAFLEAKNIKKTYMLEDIDESDEEDSDLDNLSDYSESHLENLENQ